MAQFNGKPQTNITSYVFRGCTAALVLFVSGLYGCPQYNVWEQGLQGKAELARAQQNRQIKILEAQAKSDSAELEAQAEVKRAEGLAKATTILSAALSGEQGERYLRYLWVNGLEKGDNREVIYIPTEAGLPILEAGRPKHEPVIVKK